MTRFKYVLIIIYKNVYAAYCKNYEQLFGCIQVPIYKR